MSLRPLYILDILREQTDEEHRLTVPGLLFALEEKGIIAERKAIYRDIEALREYGADIVKTGTGMYLSRREFDIGELRLLISAVQAASFITQRRTELLLDRLCSFVSRYQGEGLRRQSNIGGVKCGSDEAFSAIEAANLAIAARRRLSFTYVKRDVSKRSVLQRSGKRYRVSPYAMVWVADKYYLVANMEGRNDLTHFRMDRLRSVRVDIDSARPFPEVSEYREAFPASEYASKCLNMFGGKPERIELRCENALADEVMDRFGEDIGLKREDEAYFTATVTAVPNEGLMGYVGQFGGMMEIISPPSLREGMRKRLESASALYDKRKGPIGGQY